MPERMTNTVASGPVFPRRAIVAAVLAAILAGVIAAVSFLGQITAPQSESFQFSRGLTFAQGEEARLRGFVASALADDRIVVTLVGHSGSAGDSEANLDLSLDRAEAAQEIATAAGVDADQIKVTGLGGSAALSKQDGESDRAYQARLARVEVILQVRR